MAEFLDGPGDVERNRPGRAGLGRATEDQRAGGFRRPRCLEGHGVAGDDRREVGRDAVGQVDGQVGNALTRLYLVAAGKGAIDRETPRFIIGNRLHLERSHCPHLVRGRLGKYRREVGHGILLRRAADHRAAAGADSRGELEGNPLVARVGRPDTDLGVACDVDG